MHAFIRWARVRTGIIHRHNRSVIRRSNLHFRCSHRWLAWLGARFGFFERLALDLFLAVLVFLVLPHQRIANDEGVDLIAGRVDQRCALAAFQIEAVDVEIVGGRLGCASHDGVTSKGGGASKLFR